MSPHQARLRWLIRLDDEEEETNIELEEEDILSLLRSLPEATEQEEREEEEEAAAAAASAVNEKNETTPLQRLLRLHLGNGNGKGKSHARPLDRRRALVSCLAQHVACCVGLGVEWERSPGISRTRKGGKPFAKRRRRNDDADASDGADDADDDGDAAAAAAAAAPNFNFNVSHDGPWVALAAEPLLLVGVDVTSPRVIGGGGAGGSGGNNKDSKSKQQPPPPLGVARLQRSLGSALSDGEWARVALEADAGSQDACFRRFWALREAWTKARGDGLGAADLARAEFDLGGGGGGGGGRGDDDDDDDDGEEEEEKDNDDDDDNRRKITLRVDGVVQPQWRFDLTELDDGSALAVALGPPSAVVDAGGEFRATLRRPEMSDEEVRREQEEEKTGKQRWHVLSVRDLIEEADMRRKGAKETR